MNELIKFTNATLNISISATDRDGQVWFVAKEIAEALGYAETGVALRHCDESTVLVELNKINNLGSATKWIPESDFYTLVMKSEQPNAKPFQKWVTGEVLPSIRKTGGYQTPKNPIASATIQEQNYWAMKAQIEVCQHMKLPESGSLLLLDITNKKHGNVVALPAYGIDSGTVTSGSSRVTFSASHLLKKIESKLSAIKFNKLCVDKSILEVKHRKSSKSDDLKAFYALTETGQKYGKNVTSPTNPRETQPHWFEDTFQEVLIILGEK